MTIRDQLARKNAGGPPFRLRADRILVEVDGRHKLSDYAQGSLDSDKTILDEPPVSRSRLKEVESELRQHEFNVKRLENLGVLVLEAERLDSVISSLANAKSHIPKKKRKKLEKVRKRAASGGDRTILGGWRPGMMDFGQDEEASLEARLRNELSSLDLQNSVTNALQELPGVASAEISFTRNTPGPRNLGVDPEQRPSVPITMGSEEKEHKGKPDVGDALEKMHVPSAWEDNRGEGAIVAVFDTSFCAEYLKGSRVRDTFSGKDVESAYSAPEEGHGTMTAYSAAGNKEESGLPFDGAAPDAELLLARLSNKDGSLVYIEEAWDWLIGHIKETDKPIVSNHSYGVPLCSARSMNGCSSTTTKVARVANRRDDHQAFYAAGNEGLYCGHRLSGMTNGINSINSDPTSITVGALRFDLKDAQSYTSHGFGTCASLDNNPKPDFGCLLPSIVPYGCKLKDMSSGQGGSSAGTSEATPLSCGVGALMASAMGTAEQGALEDIIEGTAMSVRPTQVNALLGHDARFGHGQIRADKAVEIARQFGKERKSRGSEAELPEQVQNRASAGAGFGLLE